MVVLGGVTHGHVAVDGVVVAASDAGGAEALTAGFGVGFLVAAVVLLLACVVAFALPGRSASGPVMGGISR